ncbi:MAG TPA: CoA transferase, partial [Ideonella sp.]|nr:CoA transferase [Ideonella sp.]
ATVAAKEANWSALLALIEGWTSQRSGAECESMLMAAGVPCSRYRSVAEAMADEQLRTREFFTELGDGEHRFKVANAPSRLSRTPTRARSGIAALGEHTEQVLAEVLGLDAGELARLRSSGALGSR